MKITFLGTGTSQGIPVIGCECDVCTSENPRDKRLRVSALIQENDTNILIDAGPDFRQQMLSSGINHLEAVLITHEHNDHIAGIDDVRPFNFRSGKDMPFFAMERVVDAIQVRFPYIFKPSPYPGAPRIKMHVVEEKDFLVNNISITPISILHGALPILGYRIHNLAYLTDVKFIPENEFKKLKNLDLLVISALQLKKHHSHCTLDEALSLIEHIKPRKALLIHMSHTMGDISVLKLPSNVAFAYDGLEIIL